MDGSQAYNLGKKIKERGGKVKEKARTLILESYRSQNSGQR
jgi:hypothetical protein